MIEVEFNNANFNMIKQTLGSWLDTGWHSGIVTNFDSRMGKGVLFLLELEKGLTVVMSDNTTKDDILYVNKAYELDNNLLFVLNYLIMGDVFVVENGKVQVPKKYPMLNKVVMHHGKSDLSFLAPKGKRSRVIDIIFSHDWLLDQFPSSQQDVINAQMAKVERLNSFYLDPISARSFEAVIELLDKVFYDNWDYIFLKSRLIPLIDEFVKNYILPVNKEKEKLVDDGRSLSMIKVKQRINTILYEKLPNMRILAKEFLMSETTLNRRFKRSFGKTINEYHLDEKMELAKRILRREEYTISQIAYLLGYETVSAFNKRFKKHFGVSPGSLRKKGMG